MITSIKPGRNRFYETLMQYSTIATILATVSASVSTNHSPILEIRGAGGPFRGVATSTPTSYVDQVTHRNQSTACNDNADIGSGATTIFTAAAPLSDHPRHPLTPSQTATAPSPPPNPTITSTHPQRQTPLPTAALFQYSSSHISIQNLLLLAILIK